MNIRECRDQGLTKKATALRLGLDRKTVAKNWDGPTDDPEKPRYKQRVKLTDSYVEHIMERLKKFPELTAERIYREIKKKGYTGSKRTVRRCVALLRPKNFREYKRGCGQKPGLISQEVVHAFLRGTNEGSPAVHQV